MRGTALIDPDLLGDHVDGGRGPALGQRPDRLGDQHPPPLLGKPRIAVRGPA